LNRYWWDAQLLEQDFDDKLSQIWMRLGIARYPLTFQVDQSKRRDYAFYLILSSVTLGIWAMVWDYKIYKIYTDPDNLVRRVSQHRRQRPPHCPISVTHRVSGKVSRSPLCWKDWSGQPLP
jgi:hypothetical protein